jgi:hypothetical protein
MRKNMKNKGRCMKKGVEKQLCPWTERMTERRKEKERNKKCVNRKPILLSFLPSLRSYSEMNSSAERIRHEHSDVLVLVNSAPFPPIINSSEN